MPLSPRTQAAIIRALAKASHAEISTAAVSVGLPDAAAGYTRHDRAAALVRATFSELPAEEASRFGLELAEEQLRRLRQFGGEPPQEASQLIDSLAVDGYAYADGRLLPATPGPASIQSQLSQLEAQLAVAGYNEAGTTIVRLPTATSLAPTKRPMVKRGRSSRASSRGYAAGRLTRISMTPPPPFSIFTT